MLDLLLSYVMSPAPIAFSVVHFVLSSDEPEKSSLQTSLRPSRGSMAEILSVPPFTTAGAVTCTGEAMVRVPEPVFSKPAIVERTVLVQPPPVMDWSAAPSNLSFGSDAGTSSINATRAELVSVTVEAPGNTAAPRHTPIPPPPARTGEALVGWLIPFTYTAPEYVFAPPARLSQPGPTNIML